MNSIRACRVGLVLAQGDVYVSYYAEALDHAGIPYELVPALNEAVPSQFDVLLFCGYGSLQPEVLSSLNKSLSLGAQAVFSGSTWGATNLLGLSAASKHISLGRVARAGRSDPWPEKCDSAKFFGGTSHLNKAGIVLGTLSDGGVGLSKCQQGMGTSWYFAPHVGQTISFIQFGRSVETDGISSLDGTVRLDDGVLRADDGITLSFESDRIVHPESSRSFFGEAHSDRVREIWIHAVVAAMEATGKPFQITWTWPNSLDAVAMLTIDCPNSQNEVFRAVHRVMANVGGRTAWMINHPGVSSDLYREIRGSLHEVGLLLNVAQATDWDTEKARIQHVSISRSSSFRHVDAIRAEQGKWEGHLKPYELAERSGARLSVSKGSFQPGAAGFAFGSCLPTCPRRPDGSRIEVMELPFQVYVPSFPDEFAETILSEIQARNGCLHVAADLIGSCTTAAQSSLHRMILLARQTGYKFLLPSEIAHFQFERRHLRVASFGSGDDAGLTVTSQNDVSGVTMLLGGWGDLEPKVNGHVVRCRPVQRYGVYFWEIILNLEGKRTTTIEFSGTLQSAAA